jgi:hypothetical protein
MATTLNCPSCGTVIESGEERCANCGANAAVCDGSLAPGIVEIGTPRALKGWRKIVFCAFAFFCRRPYLFAFATTALVYGVAALLFDGFNSINYGSTLVSSALAIALFIPGTIQEGRWKSIALMAAIGGISPFLMDWLLTYLPNPHDWVLAKSLILSVGISCLLVASQWLVTPDDSLRRLGWGLLVVIAATATYEWFSFVVMRCKWLDYSWGAVLDVCLFPIVIWIVLPFAFRVPSSASGRTKIYVAAASVASLFACLLFFRVGVYGLGETSLMNQGPFSRRFGVQLLDHRGRQQDYELILAALAEADWNVPWDRHDFESGPDWRHTAVRLLINHDREWAAKKLAGILVDRPSRALIDMTDDLFVEQRRYETAPLYLRYALCSKHSFSLFVVVGRDRYWKALEAMGVPQVVDALLYREVVVQIALGKLRAEEAGATYVVPADYELTVRDDTRRRFAALLGKDAGPYYLDWKALYEERIDHVATPLTPQQHAEANRVVKCLADYWSARFGAPKGFKLPEPNWNVPTIEQLEAEVDRYVRKVNTASVL